MEGSDSVVSYEQLKPAIDDLRNAGKHVQYDVHTHPKVNGKDSSLPSDADKANSVGFFPNVVLGYSTVFNASSGQYYYTPSISFYNKTGVVMPPIPFNGFRKKIHKINAKR